MRVLHVTSGNLFGGVETMLVMLARHRRLCPDMDPSFAICFEGRLEDDLRAAGAEVHRLGAVRLSRPWSVARARRSLAALVRTGHFDRVICHSVWPVAVFAPVLQRAAAESSLRWGFWLHDRATGRHWLERLGRCYQPQFAVCNSRFTAETLPTLYPALRDPLICYPLAGPVEPRRPRDVVRAALDTPPGDAVIIQVSRMEEWKGHALLLEALADLRGLPGWTCWQVGGPQRSSEIGYFERLRQQAAALGLAHRVRFLGVRNDVPDLLAAADIHCQPNTAGEPFGLVFMEALYAGLPVVTTSLGGAREILDPSCAVLVPPGESGALANALHALILSPARRFQLGSHGPACAARVSGPGGRLHELCQALLSSSFGPAAQAQVNLS